MGRAEFMSKTILITNGRSPAGLDLARTFGQAGHRVLVADSFRFHLGQFSRYCKSIQVPPPNGDMLAYVRRLRDLCHAENVDLVVPVYEEIFPLARFRNGFPCEILAGDYSQLKTLHDKYEFIRLCQQLGLSHPQTVLAESADQVDLSQPVVIKPRFSRFGTDVLICPGPEEVQKLSFRRAMVVQQYIEGPQYSVYCLADRGKVLLLSIYPYEATLYGVCTSYRHVELPEVRQWVERLVRELGFSGNISFDFAVSGNTVYPLECNPRITSGVHLYSGSPDLVTAFLEKTKGPGPGQQRTMISLFVMLKGLVDWKLWPIWFRSRDILFRWSDPFPLCGQIVVLAYLRYLARKQRQPTTVVSSLDIEFNDEQLQELEKLDVDRLDDLEPDSADSRSDGDQI